MIVIADSGSTTTDWMACGMGEKRAFSTQGLNPLLCDIREMESLITEVGKHIDPAAVNRVWFYGAGCLGKENCSKVNSALSSLFTGAAISVEHDLLGAARAVCGDRPGIACILGTGSNSGLFDGKDITANVPALGYLLGDEGSGAHLGKALIRSYFYDELPAEIAEAFAASYPGSKQVLLRKVYASQFPNRYLASFAPFIARHAAHPFMQQLILDSFGEFLEKHVLVYNQAGKCPVSFVGSVAYHFERELRKKMKEYDLHLSCIIKKPIKALYGFHVSD